MNRDTSKQQNSNRMKVIRKFFRRKTALVGLIIVVFFTLMAVTGLFWTPYDSTATNSKMMFATPSLTHPFGCDDMGRDIFSRAMEGASVSILVGVVSIAFALVIGTALGIASGYYRGMIGVVIDKVVEAIWAFPSLILAMMLTVILGTGIQNVIIALAIVFIPNFARIARSMTLSVRENEYVQSAVAIGLSDFTIMFRYIFPNISSALIVQASLSAASAIIQESTLSFLGLGVQLPAASWGSILKIGYTYIWKVPTMSIFPGLCIALMVLGLNFLGDGLRDALDVRTKDF